MHEMICHFTVGNTTSVPPKKLSCCVMLNKNRMQSFANHVLLPIGHRYCVKWKFISHLELDYGKKKVPQKNVFSIFSIRFINICKVRRPDAGLLSHSCLIKDFSCSKILDLFSHIFCVMMCQMFPACERSGLLAGQFSTHTLLLDFELSTGNKPNDTLSVQRTRCHVSKKILICLIIKQSSTLT